MSRSPSPSLPPLLSAQLLQRLLTVPALPSSSSSPSPTFSAFRPRGLVNELNRCFVNATLQCLLATLPFLAYFDSVAIAASEPPTSAPLSVEASAPLRAVAPTFAELLAFLLSYRAQAASAPLTDPKAERSTAEETKCTEKGSEDPVDVDEVRAGREEEKAGEEEEKEACEAASVELVSAESSSVRSEDGEAVRGSGSASRRRRRRRRRTAQGGGKEEGEAPPSNEHAQTSVTGTAAEAASNRAPLTHRLFPPSSSSKVGPPTIVTAPPRSFSPAIPPSFNAAPFAPSFPQLLSSFQKQQVGRQEDAAELLHFLLARLQEEAIALQRMRDAAAVATEDGDASAAAAADDWTEIGRKSRQLIVRPSALLSLTPISALCGLRVRSCLHIPQRHKDSVSWQAALMLPLDVPTTSGTLEASLLRFFATTEVNSHRSRGTVQTQSLDSSSLPPALIVHLKRFAYSLNGHGAGEGHRFHKLHSHVAFPLFLSLPPSILHGWPPHPGATLPRYSLAAVLVHHGETPQSGHYTAFVRHPATDYTASASNASGWLSIDDAHVKPVSTAVVLAQSAYLLTFVAQQQHL